MTKQCDLWSHQITRQGLQNMLCSVFLRCPLVIGVLRCGIKNLDSYANWGELGFSGFQGLLKSKLGCGFHSTLLRGSFDSLFFETLVAHSSPQTFQSLLPCTHQTLNALRTWKRYCHTLGPAMRIFISCVRGLLLPFGLAAGFCFLTDTIFVSQGATCGNETEK